MATRSQQSACLRYQRCQSAYCPHSDDIESLLLFGANKFLKPAANNLDMVHGASSCNLFQEGPLLCHGLQKHDLKLGRDQLKSEAGKSRSAPYVEQSAAQLNSSRNQEALSEVPGDALFRR